MIVLLRRIPVSERARPLAALAVGILLSGAVACDSTPYPVGEEFTTTVLTPPDGAATPMPPEIIDVSIADGAVRPNNSTLRARVGQPIELQVDSDSATEIYVNTNPRQAFVVAPRENQIFNFTAKEPGTLTVATRHPAQTVATLEVRE